MSNVHRRDAKTQRDQNVGNVAESLCRKIWGFISSLSVSASLRLIFIGLLFSGCSIPNLENPECTQARDTVKQFYSWYIGTDVEEKSKHLEIFKKFISPTFPLDRGSNWESDPYILTNDFPKTFKIGKCEAPESGKANVQVQLYWRDDAKTTQKEVHVEAVRTGDAWLINKVSN